ncbi:hypothetical protein [Photobacterium salinisoli]|nr:hypothetical protein [Photobacterium salinisoli]
MSLISRVLSGPVAGAPGTAGQPSLRPAFLPCLIGLPQLKSFDDHDL